MAPRRTHLADQFTFMRVIGRVARMAEEAGATPGRAPAFGRITRCIFNGLVQRASTRDTGSVDSLEPFAHASGDASRSRQQRTATRGWTLATSRATCTRRPPFHGATCDDNGTELESHLASCTIPSSTRTPSPTADVSVGPAPKGKEQWGRSCAYGLEAPIRCT